MAMATAIAHNAAANNPRSAHVRLALYTHHEIRVGFDNMRQPLDRPTAERGLAFFHAAHDAAYEALSVQLQGAFSGA